MLANVASSLYRPTRLVVYDWCSVARRECAHGTWPTNVNALLLQFGHVGRKRVAWLTVVLVPVLALELLVPLVPLVVLVLLVVLVPLVAPVLLVALLALPSTT